MMSHVQSQGDMMVLHYVAQILRQVVPLMDHPSERFLASLEEDLVKLVMKHGQMVSQLGVVGGVAGCDGHTMYVLFRLCRAASTAWEQW